MSSVMVLPGCMGSQLSLPPNVSTLRQKSLPFELITGPYWAERGLLKTFGLAPMELDGTTAGTPAKGAQALTADAPLADYYGQGLAVLKDQLKNTVHSNCFAWAYDWRQSMAAYANTLAIQIKQSFTADSPVTLVGHSMGGLLARLAYRLLRIEGKANLIRRIITLGTPHRGTYRVWELWSGNSREGFLFTLASAVYGHGLAPLALLPALKAQIIAYTMTWPSFYELLPVDPNNGEHESDFVRSMYRKDFWQYGAGFKQELADNAKTGTQPLLSDETSIPPGRKLVCLQGFGYPTWKYNPFSDPFFGQKKPFDIVRGDGDGCVLYGTGLISGHDGYQISCAHDQLFNAVCLSGLLAKIITEDFDPAPTAVPPPVKEVQNPVVEKIVNPPPFADVRPPTTKRGRPKR